MKAATSFEALVATLSIAMAVGKTTAYQGLVVGASFAGPDVANQLLGRRVLLLDPRRIGTGPTSVCGAHIPASTTSRCASFSSAGDSCMQSSPNGYPERT